MARRHVVVLLALALMFVAGCVSSDKTLPPLEGNVGQPVLVTDSSMQGYVTVQHVQKADAAGGLTDYSFQVSYQATGTMLVAPNNWTAAIQGQPLTPVTPPSALPALQPTTLQSKGTAQGWVTFQGPATLNIVNLNLVSQSNTVLVTWPINRYD